MSQLKVKICELENYWKLIAYLLKYILKILHSNYTFFFFSMWVFFHENSRITGLQGKEEGISLSPHYHFHPLHRHIGISREITAESSPLYIASSRTRTGNLWFPSASHEPLSYAPFSSTNFFIFLKVSLLSNIFYYLFPLLTKLFSQITNYATSK